MDLISDIEIAYFRSIYKQQLNKLTGTNIIFGRNDSGKSNILRALNLFFNYNTNPGQAFDFERDFCHSRRAEADSTEGDVRKFAYVKIWIKTPKNWQDSLGENFWVKKQWSITKTAEPHFESSIRDGRNKQYLTRFLNKIKFHYIPAIKDRKIFEQLLGNVYEVLASQDEFSESLTTFSKALQERTSALTDNLKSVVGFDSVISPPSDLSDLFRSLDFITTTDQGDSCSLKLQRGDGVQVRHIPTILSFLTDNGSEDFHIWGFEEPENSLELANAIEEAKVFEKYGQEKNKQIFLTSHSPAFYSLDNTNVSRYFISRSKEKVDRKVSTIIGVSSSDEEAPSELMNETPHLPLISKYLKEANDKIQSLRQEGERLAELLSSKERPILFLEGESDSIVFEAAWDAIIGSERNFDIELASGTTKMESLTCNGKVIKRLAPERTVFALVDNDHEARKLYSNQHLKDGGVFHQHNSNEVWWCRLPFCDHFKDAMKKLKIDKKIWPGSLENLFTPDLKKEAVLEGVLKYKDSPHAEFLDPNHFHRILPTLNDTNSPMRHYIYSVDPDYKVTFAKWISQKASEDSKLLDMFTPILKRMIDIISPLQSTGID